MFMGTARYLAYLAPVGLALAACEPTRIDAVTVPGDSFQPGAGCVAADLQAAGPTSCQAPAQLGFEQRGDAALVEISGGPLSAKAVSCRRTFCGAGSLVLHADYRWPPGTTPPSSEKLGELRYPLAAPVDLYGRSLTYALYLDGPTTPVNAFVAIIDTSGFFHMVDDGPVLLFRRWTQRGGAIQAANPRLNLPEGATSLMAREIRIAVYLATDVRSGDRERWSADFYLDELGWN